jgi:Flp pilus assembly protein TadB
VAVVCAVLAAAAVTLLVRPGRARGGLAQLLDVSSAGGTPQPRAAGWLSRAEPLHLAAAAGAGATALLVLPAPWGPVAAVIAMVLVWRRSHQWETAAIRRRRAALADDLPHVVDLMVAALSAGADPGEALTRVTRVVEPPTADELLTWVSRLALGTDPVTVWDAMARHPQLGRLGLALRRSAESGAPVTKALTRLAEDLRSRAGADVEARVRQVEVKAAVPLGVCLLPSFVLVGVVPLVAGSVLGFLTG